MKNAILDIVFRVMEFEKQKLEKEGVDLKRKKEALTANPFLKLSFLSAISLASCDSSATFLHTLVAVFFFAGLYLHPTEWDRQGSPVPIAS